MTVLGRAWARFRRLPAGAQAGAGVALLSIYTVALIAIAGGNGDDGAERRPLTAFEREVKGHVERGRVPQRERGDVPDFRQPSGADVRCDDTTCTIVYSIAVPGEGRVALQQADIVGNIFAANADLEKLTLKVVRGQPTGPLASPKTSEEAPIGVPLYETECDRTKAPRGVEWGRFLSVVRVFKKVCEFRNVFESGPRPPPGAPGSAPGAARE